MRKYIYNVYIGSFPEDRRLFASCASRFAQQAAAWLALESGNERVWTAEEVLQDGCFVPLTGLHLEGP